MTWRELAEYIKTIDERFLDTEVQLYDAFNDCTHTDAMFAIDCTDDNFIIDVDQPQVWFNTTDVV